MALVFFFALKTGMELTYIIYKMPVNVPRFLERKTGTGNPNKWYGKFWSVL